MDKSGISRRNFLGKAAAIGAAGVVVPSIMTGNSSDTNATFKDRKEFDRYKLVDECVVLVCGGGR